MDILRDEAFAYADVIKGSGGDVEVHAYKGVPHCFPSVCPTIPETSMFYKRFISFLQQISA